MEKRDNSGALFKNDKKEKDSQPDLKGRVMLPDGTVHWLSAWTKQGASGKWISLQIGDAVQQQGGGSNLPGNGVPPLDAHNEAKGNGFVPDDDDIPF